MDALFGVPVESRRLHSRLDDVERLQRCTAAPLKQHHKNEVRLKSREQVARTTEARCGHTSTRKRGHAKLRR
jgi:hypothetical protein